MATHIHLPLIKESMIIELSKLFYKFLSFSLLSPNKDYIYSLNQNFHFYYYDIIGLYEVKS